MMKRAVLTLKIALFLCAFGADFLCVFSAKAAPTEWLALGHYHTQAGGYLESTIDSENETRKPNYRQPLIYLTESTLKNNACSRLGICI